MASKYLDKSKFVLSVECPTKLYYQVRPEEYQNFNAENAFLEALAKAGYQVGELAKCYFRNKHPHDLSGLSIEDAVRKTSELMDLDRAVIFEATFISDNLLLRADILEKKGNSISLYEVKSKSYNKEEDSFFDRRSKKVKKLTEKWLPYIIDITFQKYVMMNIYPDFNIVSYLKLINKLSVCPTDGINQKLKISRDSHGRVHVTGAENITSDDLSEELLIDVNVDEETNHAIFERKYREDALSFSEYINFVLKHYEDDERVSPILIPKCAKCEFRGQDERKKSEQMTGFEECWTSAAKLKREELSKPLSLDLWNYNAVDKKAEFISTGKYFLDQLCEDDIKPKKSTDSSKLGMSGLERRVLQIKKARNNDKSLYMDKDGLHEAMKFDYPLHFIDFETAAPAIPIVKGVHPYEGFSFQFSHHVLHENGDVEHVDEFINTDIGVNPNLSFIRRLMESLKGDSGNIFRYHNHENTYLNYIYKEVLSSNDIDDKEEILGFIQSIAQPTDSNRGLWEPGRRNMIDLCDLVQRFTFDPSANGRTSIKKYFPAIVNESKYLQEKYSNPIYGASNGIKSHNFNDQIWIVRKGGVILDPYSLLPKIKIAGDLEISDEDADVLFDSNELKEGGAASIAYLYMQYCDMSQAERDALTKALLRYCELDTLAMVMIVEHWLNDDG